MEMIVVIVLITILSLIGVPSYRTFQAKARQKEGFNLANTYFAAATTAKVEFNFYPGNFVATAFQPQGILHYRLRVQNNTVNTPPPSIPNDPLCVLTQNACDCGGTCASYKTWSEWSSLGATRVGVSACNWATVCGPPSLTDTTFQLLVCGVPSASALTLDQYALNHRKQFTMCADGLK